MEKFFHHAADYLQQNWAVIALVVSEAAALLPGKARGIIQTVLLIVSKIFEKRKEGHKN